MVYIQGVLYTIAVTLYFRTYNLAVKGIPAKLTSCNAHCSTN